MGVRPLFQNKLYPDRFGDNVDTSDQNHHFETAIYVVVDPKKYNRSYVAIINLSSNSF